MLNPNPYMMLSGTLGFSAADLNANRLGVLTAYQRELLETRRTRALALPVILTVLLVLAGLAFQMEWLFVAFFGLTLVSIIIATWVRYQQDFDQPIEMIAGKWTVQPIYLGRYAGVVSGQRFNLSAHVINAFSENFHYRLYYTPGTHTILSAEII